MNKAKLLFSPVIQEKRKTELVLSTVHWTFAFPPHKGLTTAAALALR